MPKRRVDVVVVALATPVLVGIYEKGVLVEEIKSQERSSEALPNIFKKLLEKYELASLAYANGPGSFLSIKVTYIFLRSLSIVKGIPLFGIDAFYFNENRPIKALGKLHFVKIRGKIETKKLDEAVENVFELPRYLDKEKLSKENAPAYAIGAV